MASFVEVPADKIEQLLQHHRFERTVQGFEVVYTRKSTRNPNVVIKVYTSIRTGQASVRGAGRDSIKVCVVHDNGRYSFGIGKFPHINRVGEVNSVLSRVYERIGEAAKRANEWIDRDDNRPKTRWYDQAAPESAQEPVLDLPPTDDVPEWLR